MPRLRPGLQADLLWCAATAVLALLIGVWALDVATRFIALSPEPNPEPAAAPAAP